MFSNKITDVRCCTAFWW